MLKSYVQNSNRCRRRLRRARHILYVSEHLPHNLPYEKVGNNEPVCIAGEVSFEIPDNWVWCRAQTVLSIFSGDGLTTKDMDDGIYPVYGGNGVAGYHSKFNEEKPTLVIGMVGFYCGSTHITEKFAWVTDNAFITTFDESKIYIRWLKILLDSLGLRNRSSSTAQPVISGKTIYSLLIPLPPLAEQNRIVRQIDKIMLIIDNLSK